MDDFKRKVEEFLAGRHGSDQLSFALSLVGLILVFCSPAFTNDDLRMGCSLVGLGLIIWAVCRMFSKNESSRVKENEAFTRFFSFDGKNSAKAAERRAKKEKKRQMKEKLKTHELFYCPKCKAACFVPRGKGKVRITCPKCGEKFIGKT